MGDTLTPPALRIGETGVLTGLKAGDVAKYVLLSVRDPLGYEEDAADVIAKYLDDAVLLADTGLFRTFNGSYKGVRVTVCSTGSGAPDTELALVEMAELSPEGVFIRIGTSGSANDRVRVGDLVIASGAVRSAANVEAIRDAFDDEGAAALFSRSAIDLYDLEDA